MKIQILISEGCIGCNKIEKMFDDLGVDYELIDISKNPKFLEKFPIFVAPGVVIDDKLAFTGVPKMSELIEKIK